MDSTSEDAKNQRETAGTKRLGSAILAKSNVAGDTEQAVHAAMGALLSAGKMQTTLTQSSEELMRLECARENSRAACQIPIKREPEPTEFAPQAFDDGLGDDLSWGELPESSHGKMDDYSF
uniref:Uncharacterized protein n=1 Tax=Magnetococcus massalia (strain MO-1) TaxID=451514 RepID=A0A1S7LI89_MAGMO|nr:conserved protein of unknown function [Candidatus Magnetococcus massalia]